MALTVTGPQKISVSQEFRAGLLAAIPGLRAFAFSLVGGRGLDDRADDLVQETVVKAWAHHASFQPGTNLRAWLYTILRNEFYSRIRKHRREIADIDGIYSRSIGLPPEQLGHLDLADMRAALLDLKPEQREALLLVAASGFSYEEAAAICEVPVGTIKSRINRARGSLSLALNLSGSEFGPDAVTEAAMSRTTSSQPRNP